LILLWDLVGATVKLPQVRGTEGPFIKA